MSVNMRLAPGLLFIGKSSATGWRLSGEEEKLKKEEQN
jgi:hypothetical protein